MKMRWNLKTLIDKDDIPRFTQKKISLWKKFEKKYRKNNGYLVSPPLLKNALDEYCDLVKIVQPYDKDNLYYHLSLITDLDNPDIKKKDKAMLDISTNIFNNIEFFTLNLGKISKIKQKEFLDSKELKKYKYYLNTLFKLSSHFLSEESEKVINLLSDSSSSRWVQMTDELTSTEDIFINKKGKKKKISTSELTELFKNPDQKVRISANKKYNKLLNKYLKIGEYEINSILDTKKVSDNLRGYKFPEEANHLSNDVSTKIVDDLVKEVEKSNYIAHEYYRLKAKLLGKNKVEYYERNMPLGIISKRYSIQQAFDLVSKTFGTINDDFQNIFIDAFRNGYVDVFPKVGKSDGASCIWNSISSPYYVLLNYSNSINDVTTIAHEFGHAIHCEYMRKIENPLYFGNISSVILEVPSNFFEEYIYDEIGKTLKDDERLYLLMERLNTSISSVHRQIACYKFEKDLHAEYRSNSFVSKEKIGDLFYHRMKEYMGDYVNQPEYSKNWWLTWGHIRSFFYVYSYAFGDLLARIMRNKHKKDVNWIEDFKAFLVNSGSDSPVNVLKSIDIDLTQPHVWATGLNEIENMLIEAQKLAGV